MYPRFKGDSLTQNIQRRNNPHHISMLRNVDLPEALIFYGVDTIINRASSSSQPSIRPGVLRLIEEAKEIDTPTFILSEHLTMSELSQSIESVEPCFQQFRAENRVHYRSSLEEFVVQRESDLETVGEGNDNEDEDGFAPHHFVGEGIGYAPCPAALYDAVNTVKIVPRGFGGSSGFGVKNWEAVRPPLPQHCVVFVCSASDSKSQTNIDGSKSISRDRCIASHYAGMRVMYIEDEGLPCTAEDVADGIISSLGTEEDWEMVTVDDVSTPGSFWLNMMQPKDEEGFTVNTFEIINEFIIRRKGEKMEESPTVSRKSDDEDEELDEEELARILADLDSL